MLIVSYKTYKIPVVLIKLKTMHQIKLSFVIVLGIGVALMSSCNSKQVETAVADTVKTEPVSARPAHWGYAGEDGPTAWATLSPVYALCGNGQAQSPINIV